MIPTVLNTGRLILCLSIILTTISEVQIGGMEGGREWEFKFTHLIYTEFHKRILFIIH